MVDHRTGGTYYRKRRRRFDDEGGPRELTFSCYRRYPFLAKDRSRLWFVGALQAARQDWSIDLWAWVIMPEHAHLLIAPRETGVKIGRFAGKIKEQVARLAIAWLEEHSPQWLSKITVCEGKTVRRRFWQPGGGYDRNIDNPKTLLAMIDYIHANPVRRGLTTKPEDWEWSNARWYAGRHNVRLQMDRTLPMFEETGGAP
jgi:putative transposase